MFFFSLNSGNLGHARGRHLPCHECHAGLWNKQHPAYHVDLSGKASNLVSGQRSVSQRAKGISTQGLFHESSGYRYQERKSKRGGRGSYRRYDRVGDTRKSDPSVFSKYTDPSVCSRSRVESGILVHCGSRELIDGRAQPGWEPSRYRFMIFFFSFFLYLIAWGFFFNIMICFSEYIPAWLGKLRSRALGKNFVYTIQRNDFFFVSNYNTTTFACMSIIVYI
ncbi:hypothetical protein AA313_de0202578 [Arthrobotrys entomopaga]|nr:hypothetical protein AA313_de0202578 [Arthrobotrys entomopaga]